METTWSRAYKTPAFSLARLDYRVRYGELAVTTRQGWATTWQGKNCIGFANDEINFQTHTLKRGYYSLFLPTVNSGERKLLYICQDSLYSTNVFEF